MTSPTVPRQLVPTNLLRWFIVGVVVLFIVLYPLLGAGEYMLHVFIIFLTQLILVVSLRFIIISAGFSLAHVALMGVGGYTSAVLTRMLGFPFWVSLPLGGITAGFTGLLIGMLCFRTRDLYFLLMTYALAVGIGQIWLRFTNIFKGNVGISGVPRPGDITIPGLVTLNFNSSLSYFYLTLVVTAVLIIFLYHLNKSRVGTSMQVVGSQENLAEALGIGSYKYKIIAVVIASICAGIAGVLQVHYTGMSSPRDFDFSIMLYIVVYSMVGGTRTFTGPILGLGLFTLIIELWLKQIPEYQPFVLGIILILTVLFVPGGLESLPERVKRLIARVRKAAS